jgi:hypothetical protein
MNNDPLFDAVIAGCAATRAAWNISQTASDYASVANAAEALATQIDGLVPAYNPAFNPLLLGPWDYALMQSIVSAVLQNRFIVDADAAHYAEIANVIVAMWDAMRGKLVAYSFHQLTGFVTFTDATTLVNVPGVFAANEDLLASVVARSAGAPVVSVNILNCTANDFDLELSAAPGAGESIRVFWTRWGSLTP